MTYFAPLKNLVLNPATKAKGILTFTGVNGSIIPLGTKVLYNNMEFITTEAKTIVSNVASVKAESVNSGSENNTISSISLYLMFPIEGIDNQVFCTDGFTNALDEETKESLRTRCKQRFASPTIIDNDYSYRSKINELSFVKQSFISNLKNGAGSFGVTILTNTTSRVPTEQDMLDVKQYLMDSNSIPSYVAVEFFVPTIISTNFTIILAVDNEANRKIVTDALMDYLYLYQKPNTVFSYKGLADYLQTFGARLNTPLPSTTEDLKDNELIDIGTISWI